MPKNSTTNATKAVERPKILSKIPDKIIDEPLVNIEDQDSNFNIFRQSKMMESINEEE